MDSHFSKSVRFESLPFFSTQSNPFNAIWIEGRMCEWINIYLWQQKKSNNNVRWQSKPRAFHHRYHDDELCTRNVWNAFRFHSTHSHRSSTTCICIEWQRWSIIEWTIFYVFRLHPFAHRQTEKPKRNPPKCIFMAPFIFYVDCELFCIFIYIFFSKFDSIQRWTICTICYLFWFFISFSLFFFLLLLKFILSVFCVDTK